jgi:signal transduction histidine kinase
MTATADADSLTIPGWKQGYHNSNNKAEKIQLSFQIADAYMDLDQYDSAQIWLSEIYELQRFSETQSLSSYFIFTRQSEIYYYNNLLELGLQNAFQSLSIAKNLKDSILLADAYNFIGLFCVTTNRLDSAVHYLSTALQYARPSGKASKYLSLTKPHHIYSNLSETYDKKNQTDSAILFIEKSLLSATNAGSQRGIALAYHNKAKLLLRQSKADTAELLFHKSLQIAAQNHIPDIVLFCNLGLARCKAAQYHPKNAKEYLNQALGMIDADTANKINSRFRTDFLKGTLSLYGDWDDEQGMLKTYRYWFWFEQQDRQRMNAQAQFVIAHSFSLEKELLQLEILKQRQEKNLAKSRLYLLALTVIIGLILGAFGVYFYLRNKRSAYERQKAILAEREQIIADLHDDVGGGLSSLRILSELLTHSETDPKQTAMYAKKMLGTTKELSQKMSTFYWALNTEHDHLQDFSEFVKKYADEFFSTTSVHLEFSATIRQNILLNGNQRKHLFLCVKELLNNIVKHAEASVARITIDQREEQINITIEDNGKGFGTLNSSGNGLKNIRKRAASIGAQLEIQSKETGVSVSIQLPIVASH